MTTETRWSDVQRLESWAGEVRSNLIRLAALLVFYGHHLFTVYTAGEGAQVTVEYHTSVTSLVLAWSIVALLLYFCLARRWVPPVLKYLATGWDLLLITALLLLTADSKSMLALLYFLVIAAAALRLSLPLVWTATLGSIAGYGFFLGYLRFWLELPPDQRLSRTNQIIFVLALGAAGILAGQMVRQVRRIVQGYPVTVAETAEGPS
jgi:hypothetical protein